MRGYFVSINFGQVKKFCQTSNNENNYLNPLHQQRVKWCEQCELNKKIGKKTNGSNLATFLKERHQRERSNR